MRGKVALITGAGGGIGRGIARCLAEEGVHAALADISPAGAEAAAREIGGFGVDAVSYALDVTDKARCAAVVDAVARDFGALDIVVNNAGVIGGADFKLGMPLSDVSEEDWDAAYSVNVKGVFLLCQASLEKMKGRGWGRIINISSRAGRDGRETIPHYSASKAAVIIFTQALAREVAREGVTVNAVCPGVVQTSMVERVLQRAPGFDEVALASEPIGRFGQPAEIGEAVVWLCSDAASFVTGIPLSVDGGLVAQ